MSRSSPARRLVPSLVTSLVASLDPLDVFAQAGDDERIFWEHPDEGHAVAGVGAAWAFTATGTTPVAEAASAWRAYVEEAGLRAAGSEAPWGAGVLALGGFAFVPGVGRTGRAGASWRGFPPARIVIPRVTVSRVGSTTWMATASPGELREQAAAPVPKETAHVPPPPAHRMSVQEIPPADEWKALVRRAADAVRDGAFTKVVLARALVVRGVGSTPAQVLRRLRVAYPGCTLFAVTAGDCCFLGATPERLIRLRAGDVATEAVAGSAPRGAGAGEDRRLGEELRASPKERLEHAVVVDVVRGVMEEVCVQVKAPAEPELLRVANVQHLVTPLAGRLRDPLSALDLVERLHPTPAVGGFPRHAALAWIERHEDLSRGWYAGPIGWINPDGEGEFAVAIRSAVMRGSEAVLFAGCGIVADSDPDQEYAESALKMRPLLEALGAMGG
jgi:isochorismate synthase